VAGARVVEVDVVVDVDVLDVVSGVDTSGLES
jgi:hypothetical protein